MYDVCRLKKIEKEILNLIKFKNKNKLIEIYKILKCNNELLTHKKDCVLFNLSLLKLETIEKLENCFIYTQVL